MEPETDLTTPLISGTSKTLHDNEVVEAAAVLHIPTSNSTDEKEEAEDHHDEHELNGSLDAIRFLTKFVAWPLAFIIVNIFVFAMILSMSDNSEYRIIGKDGKLNLVWFLWATAFFSSIDAVILFKFASNIESKIADYWRDLSSDTKKNAVNLLTEDEEEEEEEQCPLPAIGSRISMDYVYVFASHQFEIFLRRQESMRKERIQKSTFLNIVYLMATFFMLTAVINFTLYGTQLVVGLVYGRSCFTGIDTRQKTQCQYRDFYKSTKNDTLLSLSEQQNSKLPPTVLSWSKNAKDFYCRTGRFFDDEVYHDTDPISFIRTVDGDVFFFGSDNESRRWPDNDSRRWYLIQTKKDENVPIFHRDIVYDCPFILDENENDHMNVKRFCLKLDSYSQSYTRLLCHPSAIDIPVGTFQTIKQYDEFLKGSSMCREKLEDDLLLSMCFGRTKMKRVGGIARAYTASSMEEVFRHEFEFQLESHDHSKSTHREVESEIGRWCSFVSLVVEIISLSALIISGLLLLKVKQLPVGVILLFTGPGYTLKDLPMLFVFYFVVPAALLISSLLNGEPPRPDWLSREMSWWLVYFSIILFWTIALCGADNCFHYTDDNFEDALLLTNIASCIALLVLNFKFGHPIIRTFCCAVFTVSPVSIPVFLVVGATDAFYWNMILLLLIFGLGAIGSQLSKHRPLLDFLWRQILRKMGPMGKHKRNEM